MRISLGGGGTDLPSYYSRHGGLVLSAGIDKYVYIYVNRPCADDLIRIKYSTYEEVSCVEQVRHDLVQPALRLLDINRRVEIVSMADVPAGTGLGSSGAYLVALLTALYALKREHVPLQTLAEHACHIEMNMAGHPVGKHDHYLAAFGGLTCLEIEPDGKILVSALDLPHQTLDDLHANTLLYFTGKRRSSRQILAAQQDDTNAGRAAVVDSLHRTREIGYKIKEALQAGNLDRFGELLHEHWLNKKHRNGQITDPEIERWYQVARDNGTLGGKIMGAGGGGFFMFYCPNSHKAGLRGALAAEGLREMPYDFDFEGAKVLVNF